MKKITLLLVSFSISLTIYGQQSTFGTVPGKAVDLKTGSGGVLTQLPMAPAETKGTLYLESEWLPSEIKLYGDNTVLKGYPVKYNLKTNDLEVLYKDNVKILSSRKVEYFTLTKAHGLTRTFINGEQYKIASVPLAGFLQVIDTGTWQLLIKPEVKIIKSSYNPALDIGERSDQIVKDEKFLLSKGKVLYDTELPRKKFVKQFVGNEAMVLKFLKEENIQLKNIHDLSRLRDFLLKSLQ